MSSSILSTGISALQAFQRALETTSHNISNVATEGYSRQTTEFDTRDPHKSGGHWVGSGVDVAAIRRQYDELLALHSRMASSALAHFDTLATHTERINNLFSATDTGLSATLQKFANALQDVANTPSSIAAREALLGEARNLAERLRTYDAQLAQFDRQTQAAIDSEVERISALAANIARLNDSIAISYGNSGRLPNDLLDQRDRLLDKLATHLDTTAIHQSDGTVNVFIGSGQALVLGSVASGLQTIADPYDASQRRVALINPASPPTDITPQLSGGSLGGLLDFRSQVLDPTRNALGRLGVALATTINEQHRAGADLTGAAGTDLFAVGTAHAHGHAANTGTASLLVTRTDPGSLTEADYTLQFTAGGWTLKRNDNGITVPLTGSGTAADPLVADGLSIVINGVAQTGDRFLIRPTHGAASGMQVLISDPSRIAAASLTPPTGPGDNRNALAMAEALKQPLLDGGTLSIHAAATRLVGRVGIAASQAQANRSAQQTIQREAAAALDSVRGVNLDEEAANLLRYQQAYQAAAQMIRVANTLFDTLLGAAR